MKEEAGRERGEEEERGRGRAEHAARGLQKRSRERREEGQRRCGESWPWTLASPLLTGGVGEEQHRRERVDANCGQAEQAEERGPNTELREGPGQAQLHRNAALDP
ncbi:hypothetical protein NDU88_005686 [Pleurodeles waltl]|uniref:Uncharacterized protein n=1 Tax=Pleurodeles waltl TaxID=8319 RepID=A0AAV7WZD1_PLEWA|nr:hypothetical protein NDU88_005686 [Pleurodeles waltl]